MSVVLFTGAGASNPFGYPITTEFFNQIDSKYSTIKSNLQSSINSVFYGGNNRVLDAEDVFQFLEVIEDFRNNPYGRFIHHGYNNEGIKQALEFYQYSKKLCFYKYSHDISVDTLKSIYLPLLNKCGWEDAPISLYTTNYDRVPNYLNAMCKEKDLNYYDGFRDGEWNINEWDIQTNGLKVYHLHGSIYWIEDDNKLKKLPTLKTSTYPHFVLFPGFKGNPKDENEYYGFLHNKFEEDLNKAKYLIVIGFSFRDEYINSIVENALKTNNDLIICILTPPPMPSIMAKLNTEHTEYQGRIRHFPHKFEEKSHYLEKLLSP